MKKRIKRNLDWEKLKLEWLASDLTLNAFRKMKEIRESNFYKEINEKDWRGQKERLQKKTETAIENKIVEQKVKGWEMQIKLWKSLEVRVAILLKKAFDNEHLVKIPRDSSEFANLANILERCLKNQKLIYNEPTDIVDGGNIQVALVQFIKNAFAAKVLPPTLEQQGSKDGQSGAVQFREYSENDLKQALENPKPL